MHPEDDTTCQQGVYQEIASLGETAGAKIVQCHIFPVDMSLLEPREGEDGLMSGRSPRRPFTLFRPDVLKALVVNKFCAGGKVGDHATGNCGLGQRLGLRN